MNGDEKSDERSELRPKGMDYLSTGIQLFSKEAGFRSRGIAQDSTVRGVGQGTRPTLVMPSPNRDPGEVQGSKTQARKVGKMSLEKKRWRILGKDNVVTSVEAQGCSIDQQGNFLFMDVGEDEKGIIVAIIHISGVVAKRED